MYMLIATLLHILTYAYILCVHLYITFMFI